MNEEKRYREPDLSLLSLSEKLSVKSLILDPRAGTIIEIALDVGFNSPSSFYQYFQKVTGVSPPKFREQRVDVSSLIYPAYHAPKTHYLPRNRNVPHTIFDNHFENSCNIDEERYSEKYGRFIWIEL